MQRQENRTPRDYIENNFRVNGNLIENQVQRQFMISTFEKKQKKHPTKQSQKDI